MNFTFHPEAREEFIEAIAYYESARGGLGLEFSREIHSTINRVVERPLAWALISENTRRCLAKRFPYGVIYEVLEDGILIIGITQLNREPGYWRNRTK
ncbi:MAG: type II toxin-antitoxin system RelE/ParE family toxin [Acidobacteria bacterium]|nr:type II toxin-antitoxin system RelE/ParE family toxin [Acidobacteriota bacterium]